MDPRGNQLSQVIFPKCFFFVLFCNDTDYLTSCLIVLCNYIHPISLNEYDVLEHRTHFSNSTETVSPSVFL